MSETLGIDEWLVSTLTGDATLTGLVAGRVYTDAAPIDAGFPCVVIRPVSAEDVMAAGQDRVMVVEHRLVEAIVDGESYTPCRAIVDRVDVLLHHRPSAGSQDVGTWSGTTVLACTRIRTSRLSELADGRHYRRLGAIYQILAQ